jgi:hypothetical protein
MHLKRIMKNKIFFLSIAFAISTFCFDLNTVNAAKLQINSDTATLSPGGITTLSVIVNSEGVSINNAEAKIVFPADLLEVVSINKSGSIFSLWVEEPSYSNITGIITFNGGIPTPGFTGSNGTAISIVVKAKEVGQANFIFSDSAVRANDGLGTDVLNSKNGKTLSIVKNTEPAIAEPPAVAPVIAILPLQITSPTHPSQELWYKDVNPLLRWKVPTGIDAVQISMDNNTSGSPRVIYSPAINQKSFQDLKDGIWYFKSRARKNGVWGPVTTFITRVDSTAPQKNNVSFSYNDQKKVLSINSDIVDETSGLDHYEIFVNDILIKKVPSSDFVNNEYSITIKTPGENNVKLLAVDRAGNSVETLGSFNVTPIVIPSVEPVKPTPPVEQSPVITIGTFSIPAINFAIIALSGIIILVLSAFKIGSHYSEFHNKIKTRTALSKGDNVKVLLSLKKRLEKHLEILQRTRHNRPLSKEERDIKEEIEIDLDEVDKAIENQKEG